MHPTELVFVLDQSRDVTEQQFEQMKEMTSSLVNGVRVRENSCPVGARIAILSYNSHAKHLIRFSDAYKKNRLLREIEAIPYERSTDDREIGKVMRFISRNVFKRTFPGAHTRRIATFFSSGQSADTQSITTATMEFAALDIIPVVIAFSNVPSIKRAFAVRSICFSRDFFFFLAEIVGWIYSEASIRKYRIILFITRSQEIPLSALSCFILTSTVYEIIGIIVIPIVLMRKLSLEI